MAPMLLSKNLQGLCVESDLKFIYLHKRVSLKKSTVQDKQNGISEDMQLFIDKFEPAKYKLMDYGIEVRGIKDIHRSLAEATAIIERLELKVSISHDAGMLSYGAFEVRKN